MLLLHFQQAPDAIRLNTYDFRTCSDVACPHPPGHTLQISPIGPVVNLEEFAATHDWPDAFLRPLDAVSLDLDDDDDYYGRSYEEEVAMSPSVTGYMYQRQRTAPEFTLGTKLSEFIPEERHYPEQADYGNEQMFDMDVDDGKETKPSTSTTSLFVDPGPRPGLEFDEPSRPSKPIVISLGSIAGHEEEKPVIPNITNLRVSEPCRSGSKSPSRKKSVANSSLATLPANSSSHRLNQLAAITSAPSTPRRTRRREEGKQLINLVVVGHVDAGKSTLMGHLLYRLGCVDQRTIHKYKQESARSGKASFAFAWILDETEEERARGVTMDIAKTTFETDSKRVLLLDAPGHKDFIPNMITGASQADAAILVVNSTQGEFETGFDNGGQTREHAMLLRSLGVGQLVVAVNKLDTVDWSQERFNEVEAAMKSFLTKQAGFSKVRFVPVSGLNGDNLSERVSDDHPLRKWYSEGCLLEYIDTFSAPSRASEGPLRIVINDVFKATTTQLSLSGKIESGEVETGDKVFIMPNADAAVVKACSNDDGGAIDSCVAGDHTLLTLSGTFEPDTIHAGHVIVRGGPDALMPCRRFVARIVVFDVVVPIMKGTKAELYCHSLCEPCTIVKLISSINKANGHVIKERPRCLSKQMSGLVEIETEREVAVEAYTNCKALGRITIRAGGQTIAAGIIERKLN
ncbi:elongation factor 1-alpha domain protein [Necator americanus]|uniref:Elongation factor 1-alpha domain protein n=1 Tax=Necator americanus TaxID=51031 RepID=W2SVL2_NECAM|nr:elongation factor 1-alpha domain protein [Necator americanus]ETN73695.1 elongation factor 1-alpha domain protein [Necator americanus]